jgi:hypothetical protein
MTRLALLLLLSLPAVAHAADAKTIPEESPKRVNAEVRFGGLFLQDDNLQASYGTGGEFFTTVEVGLVPWSKYVHLEIDFSFGFSQFKGTQSFIDGGSSADQTMMTFFPLGVDLTVGLDLVYEQPVMPYGGVGFNLTPWRENNLESSGEWSGVKFGPQVFFGGAFLLDVIEPTRSRALDAASGINDVYLTVEGRYRNLQTSVQSGVVNNQGLNLGGWSVSGGLKFVF